MTSFVQGDHGVQIPFVVPDQDLTNASVKVAIRFQENTIIKDAEYTFAPKGKCYFTLQSSDIPTIGKYSYQWTCYLEDGRFYSGKIYEFEVTDLMVSIPPTQDNPEPLIIPFATKDELNTLTERVKTIEQSSGSGGGGSTLTFTTLTDLEATYPNGTNQPVWITSENSWYYWDGVLPDSTPPEGITNLTVGSIGVTTVDLSWTSSTSTDLAHYEVSYSTDGVNFTIVGSSVTGTSYTVTGLASSTSYTISVVSIDSSGNRSAGVTTSVTTNSSGDVTPPNDVTNLIAGTPTSSSIPLTWTASSSTDVMNYEVSYSSNGVDYIVASNTIDSVSTSYTVTGLNELTSYTVKVVVVDTSGNRSNGVAISVATTEAPTGGSVTYTSFISDKSGALESGTTGWKMSQFQSKQDQSLVEIFASSGAGGASWELWSCDNSYTLQSKIGSGTFGSTVDAEGYYSEILSAPINLTMNSRYVVAINYTTAGAGQGAKSITDMAVCTNNTLINTTDLKGQFGVTPVFGTVMNKSYVYDIKIGLT